MLLGICLFLKDIILMDLVFRYYFWVGKLICEWFKELWGFGVGGMLDFIEVLVYVFFV